MKRAILPVAIVVVLAACGGGGDGSESPSVTDTPSTDSVAGTPTTDATETTDAPVAQSIYDVLTAREEPLWSDVVDGAYADLDNIEGSAAVNEAWARLFAWPFEVPLPDDAQTSYALTDISPYEAEWYQRFALHAVTDVSIDDARNLVADYQNELFTTGMMVESNLTDGDFFTYNFESTPDAEAAGWYSFSITVGPETNIDGATGRTEIEFSLDRYASEASKFDISFFIRGWMAEAPLDPTLDFAGIYTSWSDLVDGGPNDVDVEITFTTDQSRWAEVMSNFDREWIQDGLVMDSPYVPDDPNSTDYVPMTSFATMGMHEFDLILERDSSDAALPMKVRYGVSVGAPS